MDNIKELQLQQDLVKELSTQVIKERKSEKKQYVIKKASKLRADSRIGSSHKSIDLGADLDYKNGNAPTPIPRQVPILATPKPIKPKLDINRLREESKQKMQRAGARHLVSPQKRSKTVKLEKVAFTTGGHSKHDIENSIDWILYRKKHNLDKKTKIFICWGYVSFKKALLERGWHENTDLNSSVFHMKFAVKKDDIYKMRNPDDIDSHPLYDFQMVNHFSNNNLLTSKVGLCNSLKNLTWWTDDSMESFFPSCFVISKVQGDKNSTFQNDIEDFNEEYRFIYSSSILKKYTQIANEPLDKYIFQIPKILVSLNICEKRLLTIDEQINQFGECNGELCSETEWKILELTKKQMTIDKMKEINDKKWFQVLKNQYITLFREKELIKNTANLNMETQYPLLYEFTRKVLKKLGEKYTQFDLHGSQNLWIIKPGHASRGRGIVVMNKYYEILKYIKEAKGRNWVIQKYIENPMIINKRKFDIRQWVLVTSWNPLTVWIYSENYIRFALMDYDPKNKTKFSHLTNNCLVQKFQNSPLMKKHKRDKDNNNNTRDSDSESSENEDPENIWSCQDFQEYLQTNYNMADCQDIFREKIMTQIKHQVKASTLSVQDMVDNRKNCFEFFGYDFMVDENLRVWLIEVNSSPSMDSKNQPVLAHLVRSVLTDLAKVVVDYPKNKKSDVGKFELVVNEKTEIQRPKNSMNIDLKLNGHSVYNPNLDYGTNFLRANFKYNQQHNPQYNLMSESHYVVLHSQNRTVVSPGFRR